MDEKIAWKKVREELVKQTPFLNLWSAAYQMPDGKVFQPFYIYSRRSFVVVVPRTTEGRFLCVRQYRPGVDKVTTEFPAGGIERSDFEAGQTDAPLDAVKRELLEETGYTSDSFTLLLSSPANSTWSRDWSYLYMADNCRKVAGQKLDRTEFIELRQYTAPELDQLIETGHFEQVTSILAWKLAQPKFQEK